MSDEIRDLLERELENVVGDLTPTELLGRVADSLPEDTTFGEAKQVAEEILEEPTATDGGTASAGGETPDETTPDLPTPADGEAHFSGSPEFTATLRARDWWVNWVLAVPYGDDGEPDFDATATKQPVAPYQNGHARPVQWNAALDEDEHPSTSFVEVVEWDGMQLGKDLEAVERVLSDELGIGIIIPVGQDQYDRPITLLDWDDVRDPETGEVHPVCAEALDRLDGFAEISQSGEGIHQFVFGEIPGGMKKFLRHIDDEPFVGDSLPMIEMYSSGRLTAMTGRHVAGCGKDIVDGQDLVDDICWEFGTWSNNSSENPTDPFARYRDGDVEYTDTPSHDEIGRALRDAIAYDGDDPTEWGVPEGEPVEYHAVLRARQREPEMVNTAHWELLGYAAALAYQHDIPKEQLLEDLRAHPRPGYEFDESKARKEIRGVWRKAETGNYEAPSTKTLARRGILPDDYAAPDWPVYDVVESAGIELHLIPINGKEVKVAIEQNGQRAYTEKQERGFWENGTKRGRLAGRVADVLTGASETAIREGVKGALNQASVDADADEDAWKESMRTEREQELRDRTTNVVCYPAADEAEWVITLIPPKESSVTEPQEITFDQGDFNDANAGSFRNKHLATFYTKIEIDANEWFDLVEYWLGIQETKERDPDHELDAAVEGFTHWVKTMQVWADEEGYDPNSRNGYYWPDYENGKDAICVPGRKVVEWQKREDFGEVNLSRALKERDILITSSERRYIDGDQHSVWPVNAEMTNHTYETAHRVVDEDDDDEKPEGLRG